MKLRLIKIRDRLSDSFWFIPTLMAVLAAVSAEGSVAIDHIFGRDLLSELGMGWSGSPDGARSVLSTVAGSLMTVTSIVFSLTVTTLSQTSSQFGPRVLRNFTSDRGVQVTLGTFIATFVYCLLVLRTVRSVDETKFVPNLSVNIGVVLALVSLGVLIYFIHHIAQSIQAETLIADVGRDFQSSAALLFPKQLGHPEAAGHGEDQAPPEEAWQEAEPVLSETSGYLQRIDDAQLMFLAKRHDLVVRLIKRPGEFIAEGTIVLRALPRERCGAEVRSALMMCFSTGGYRTPHQDALYPLQQLVEIASRALSPGMNEPFTALTCLDWLGASLRHVVCRELPSAWRFDDEGRLRVVARPVDFDQVTDSSFEQIRIHGSSNPVVSRYMLSVIASLAPDLRREADRLTLIRHVELIRADAVAVSNAEDQQRVRDRAQETLHALAKRQAIER